ncbi:hypothetical protein SAMN06264364_103184 [Quadrisphaera granulorum]|uniref:Uncharacterized protein n=1 Tax=Quadrisphaera granulorum TaxID=317664 RepID=A0A316ADM2_9ACTN|nr:hypothetical protein BXY45_103184 [Quadrisphaera granulorum]SZE95573.1 hypothetical protein SAMN06264364_103184 [Quadrisphaera granulorum]
MITEGEAGVMAQAGERGERSARRWGTMEA